MESDEEGVRAPGPRSRRFRATIGRAVAEWWGPAALAVYVLTPLSGTALHGPEPLIWSGLVAVAAVSVLAWRRRLLPTQLMGLEVLVAALVADYKLWGDPLRDLHLDLRAGAQFLAGGSVYTLQPITQYPAQEDHLPYLYPPPTLPVFGLLSMLPGGLVEAVWVAGSVAVLLVSLRLIGLSWRWSVLALVWTPIEQGIFVGNVVIPSLALLAVAPHLKEALPLGSLFKPQNGVVALWLIRERAWRSLALGVLVLGVVVATTLPLTGAGVWRDWWDGLAAYQRSQQFLPGLYGIGLGRFLPAWAFLAVAVAATAAALMARGREGLARLGLASVIASPSLWSHGFVFAIPAFLRLRAEWFWLAAGLMCLGKWPGPQIALAIAAGSWFVVGLARRTAETELTGRPEPTGGPEPTGRPERDGLHPLGAKLDPWPTATD
jgi:Glycosyltransferase family 87